MPSENTANSASPIIFYCKDCGKVVNTERVGKKYVYKCKICGTKNVAFGTDKSIKSFFRVPEEKGTVEMNETPKRVEDGELATANKDSESAKTDESGKAAETSGKKD